MFCSTTSGFNSGCLNPQELEIVPCTVLPSPNKHSLSISNFAQKHWWYHLSPNLLLLLFFLFYPSLLGVLKRSEHEASPMTDLLGSKQDTTGTKAESILRLLFFLDRSRQLSQFTDFAHWGKDRRTSSIPILYAPYQMTIPSGVTKHHFWNQTAVLENFTFPSKFPLKSAQAAVLR